MTRARTHLLVSMATTSSSSPRPEDTTVPRPGFGWVHVRAQRLDPRAIVEALERGDFYSSSGVARRRGVLAEMTSSPATYVFKGDEGYVRATVIESNGKVAWIQPVPVGTSSPK